MAFQVIPDSMGATHRIPGGLQGGREVDSRRVYDSSLRTQQLLQKVETFKVEKWWGVF